MVLARAMACGVCIAGSARGGRCFLDTGSLAGRHVITVHGRGAPVYGFAHRQASAPSLNQASASPCPSPKHLVGLSRSPDSPGRILPSQRVAARERDCNLRPRYFPGRLRKRRLISHVDVIERLLSADRSFSPLLAVSRAPIGGQSVPEERHTVCALAYPAPSGCCGTCGTLCTPSRRLCPLAHRGSVKA